MDTASTITEATTATPAHTEPELGEAVPSPTGVEAAAFVEDELLVEEISIDGMCGVY